MSNLLCGNGLKVFYTLRLRFPGNMAGFLLMTQTINSIPIWISRRMQIAFTAQLNNSSMNRPDRYKKKKTNIGWTNKRVQINWTIIKFLTQRFHLKMCLSCWIRRRALAEEAAAEIPRWGRGNHTSHSADNIDGILMQFTSNARVSAAGTLIKERKKKNKGINSHRISGKKLSSNAPFAD